MSGVGQGSHLVFLLRQSGDIGRLCELTMAVFIFPVENSRKRCCYHASSLLEAQFKNYRGATQKMASNLKVYGVFTIEMQWLEWHYPVLIQNHYIGGGHVF